MKALTTKERHCHVCVCCQVEFYRPDSDIKPLAACHGAL